MADIPVLEPNDRNRLGYHVWLYATGKLPTLVEAVHDARAKLLITEEEALSILTKRLKDVGIPKKS